MDAAFLALQARFSVPALGNLRACGNVMVVVAGESVRDMLKCALAMVPSPVRNYTGIGKREFKIKRFL
jgi:hypothetical protein